MDAKKPRRPEKPDGLRAQSRGLQQARQSDENPGSAVGHPHAGPDGYLRWDDWSTLQASRTGRACTPSTGKSLFIKLVRPATATSPAPQGFHILRRRLLLLRLSLREG